MSDPGVKPERSLRQAMGTTDVVLFFVVAVMSNRWIATAAAAGPSALVVWGIVLVAFFLPLGFTVVELSSRLPGEGGVYLWTKEAFGDSSAFLAGWTYWASNLVYFPGLLYFAASSALYVGGPSWQGLQHDPRYFVIVSLAGLALATWLNLVGLHVGKWLHNLGAIAGWLPTLVLIGCGLMAAARFGSATDFSPSAMLPSMRLKDLVFWSTIAFGFAGFESASLMGDEIRDARRSVPRAILVSGVIIAVVYILGTAAVLMALPVGQVSSLEGFMQATSASADKVGFGVVTPTMAALIALGTLGGVGAWLAATARLPFVAGIDRYLPAAFSRVHPRWRTPWVAILSQSGLAAVFVVLGQAGTTVRGAYDLLVSLGIISYFIPYLYMFAAMIRLQGRPAPEGTMQIPGGKPVAVLAASLGFLTTAVSIVLALIPSPDEPHPAIATVKVVGTTIALLLVGGWLFRRGERRRAD